jgi:hypothetical protein
MKIHYISLIFLFLFPTFALTNELPNKPGSRADAWLKKADTYMNALDSELMVNVQIFEKEKLIKERQYQVYTQNPRKTIVLFHHQAEKGQKVLMKEHNFWMFLPRSKRGLRITPQQKLFGDAATGDITNIRWSDDYQGNVNSCDETQCELVLEKKRRGPTYKKILLYLDKKNALPLTAKLHLNQHKVAKYAHYFFRKTEDGYQISKIEYKNAIKKKQKTFVNFSNIIEKKTPSRWYTPSYLSTHATLK